MTARDPFALLRAADPARTATPARSSDPTAGALFAEIVGTPRKPARRSRRRLVVAVTVALVALASVAATWLSVRKVSNPIDVVCYRAANLHSDRSAAPIGADALDASLCEEVWRDGTLINEEVAPPGEVPPLHGCVTDSGNLAVFPSDDPAICEKLGLAEPLPGFEREETSLRQLTDDLVTYFLAQNCQTMEQARRDVRQILDDHGRSDWVIQTIPGEPGDPCASFGIDAPTKTIHLVPIPRLDTP
jgi:hypothetical protein